VLNAAGGQKEAEATAAPRAAAAKPASAKTALDRAALDMLSKAVTASADEDGRANLGRVGAHLAKQSPDFDPRNYGFPRLSNLVEASGIAVVERTGDNQKIITVRLKGRNPVAPRNRLPMARSSSSPT
jgi:OST-HTH/LOTUS domain